MWPYTIPFTVMRPRLFFLATTDGTEKEVLSMTRLPISRIWGRANMTMMMEITVPRPRLSPMPAMTGSEVMLPMRKPQMDMMAPEVKMVGKAKFSVSTMALRWAIFAFSS